MRNANIVDTIVKKAISEGSGNVHNFKKGFSREKKTKNFKIKIFLISKRTILKWKYFSGFEN